MREKKRYLLEVHVGTLCFSNNQLLIAKRSKKRSLYPGLWECGGGQVQTGENFEEAAIREAREELGVIVVPKQILTSYEILIPSLAQKKIPGIKFLCEITGFVSGNGPIISEEHSERTFIKLENLDSYQFIPGVDRDIQSAFSLIK